MTVLAYDQRSADHVLEVAFEQLSVRDADEPTPPPCKKEFLFLDPAFDSLMTTVEHRNAAMKVNQPKRKTGTNATVQQLHITPAARVRSQTTSAFSGGTPASVSARRNLSRMEDDSGNGNGGNGNGGNGNGGNGNSNGSN